MLIEVLATEFKNKFEYDGKDFVKYDIKKDYVIHFTPSKLKVDNVEYRGCILMLGRSKDAVSYTLISPFSRTEIEIINEMINKIKQPKKGLTNEHL